jgi:hypothetical protein
MIQLKAGSYHQDVDLIVKAGSRQKPKTTLDSVRKAVAADPMDVDAFGGRPSESEPSMIQGGTLVVCAV